MKSISYFYLTMIIMLGITSTILYNIMWTVEFAHSLKFANIAGCFIISMFFLFSFILFLIDEEKENKNMTFISLLLIIYIASCGIATAQDKEALKSDFDSFILQQGGCISKVDSCERLNVRVVNEFNSKNNTNHRHLWDIYATQCTWDKQELIRKINMLSTAKYDNNVATTKILSDSITTLTHINQNLKEVLVEVERAKEKAEKIVLNYAIKNSIQKDDIFVKFKGMFIHIKSDKLMPKSWVESNDLSLEYVGSNTYVYKPSYSVKSEVIMSVASDYKKKMRNVNWNELEVLENKQ